MAHILREVDKGICNHCFGDGWEPRFNKQQAIMITISRLPAAFDLGKCTACGGTGRRIEIK